MRDDLMLFLLCDVAWTLERMMKEYVIQIEYMIDFSNKYLLSAESKNLFENKISRFDEKHMFR